MLVDITLPNLPSWRDGKSDDQYWRVSYMIPHIPDGHHKDLLFGPWDEFTFITPELVKGVSWSAPPGGRFGIGGFGLRVIEPDSVVFVKEEGVKYISFEVVTRLPLVFAKSGVAKP